MKNIILYTDNSRLNIQKIAVNKALPPFQDLLNEVKSLDVIKINSIQELVEVARGGEIYIKKRIEEIITAPSVGIFKFKKSAAVDMLDLPSFDTLNELAKNCDPHISDAKYLKIASGNVEINPEEIDKLFWSYSVTTKTEAQGKLAEAHKKAADSLQILKESLIEVYGENHIGNDSHFRMLFDMFSDKITLNADFYNMNRTPFISAL